MNSENNNSLTPSTPSNPFNPHTEQIPAQPEDPQHASTADFQQVRNPYTHPSTPSNPSNLSAPESQSAAAAGASEQQWEGAVPVPGPVAGVSEGEGSQQEHSTVTLLGPSEELNAAQQAAAPKKSRTVPLTGAIALALVAAIGSGTLTGVYASRNQEVTSTSAVLEQLRTPVSNEGATVAAAGSVEQVAAAVLPSVVSIQVSTRTGVSEGSGSIISGDGYVLTNNHVVSGAADGAAQVVVTLNDGRDLLADFVAGDGNTDVAVIKIRDVADLPVMSFGDSSSLQVGQEVVAIGSPLGLSATVTSGIVSAMNRPVRAGGSNTGESTLIDAIQTDAAINPGNSGGPLVDMNGNLVGMNSVIASLSSGSDSSGSIGLGFAIPANFARRVADQLIATGQVTHPMLGVQLNPNSNVRGAMISEVTPGGPSEAAGLQAGDVVTRINDRSIDSTDALIAAVRSSEFGQAVTLVVEDANGANSREVQVTLTGE
ncbi:trypsin-like peptidase domain-containing protein [Corynebacterium sp. 153RC1]|uniref:S1C family serine protease n=1 Tax=unclassified Corynebacterium TaxID=2624378 RepID=UPI00211BE4B5|nr:MULTISPECIES: trypsin-like peptidase domain-containing protein [unclassified Corynebacterium]MCQ9352579.1 trypsin-like peptidase domain-containing protein [Corynebacterium sp. 209RC1]MCQ9354763.1 trypsin-like peptidase domain-containing protein [Corynebacterium sp. 1222RC1]MCQ9356948.1 trypsin-like peptidase domain-containing protein [Corynebacterium sp. 122RC1]MCQ9361416.1 trypsin-like peptidase domain-containing protein [Corynebacterium sp. 153RC1]MCQ9363541.1 trypsin-like peptidase domai